LPETFVFATGAEMLLTKAKMLATNAATASHIAKHYRAAAYILALPGVDSKCDFEGATPLNRWLLSFRAGAVTPRAAMERGLR
jgi:hypothetical protein